VRRINVRVKPGSSQEKIVENEGGLTVFMHARAHDGKANEALVKILAKHFKVPKSSIWIVQGQKSREKVVELS